MWMDRWGRGGGKGKGKERKERRVLCEYGTGYHRKGEEKKKRKEKREKRKERWRGGKGREGRDRVKFALIILEYHIHRGVGRWF